MPRDIPAGWVKQADGSYSPPDTLGTLTRVQYPPKPFSAKEICELFRAPSTDESKLNKTKHKPKSYNTEVVVQFFATFGIPEPEFEYKFHPHRKWKFDLAWPFFAMPLHLSSEEGGVAVEVQGGIWSQGRHTRGAAMLKEWEKLNEAAALGWRILYCQPEDLCLTTFAETIKRALAL